MPERCDKIFLKGVIKLLILHSFRDDFLSVITFCTLFARKELFIGSGCPDLKKNHYQKTGLLLISKKLQPPTIFMVR